MADARKSSGLDLDNRAEVVASQRTQPAEMLKRLRARNYKNLELHGKVIDGAFHTTTLPADALAGSNPTTLAAKTEVRVHFSG